jgi:arylsulfatase A-like enzyme
MNRGGRAAARPSAGALLALLRGLDVLGALGVLVLPGMLVGCGDAPAARARHSVLLVTFDTTRPDAFGCTGGRTGATPHVDALAAEGIVFDAARTVAPLTLPAHASMLTGLVPLRHGLHDNGLEALSPAAQSLAELAREQGFATGAFVGSLVLDRAYGLDQGFDVYTAPADVGDVHDLHFSERPAAEVAADAIAWLDGAAREQPFFCWLHFYDPHAPHLPKLVTPAPPAPGDPLGWTAYLAEVQEADAALGRVIDVLKRQQRYDDTTILVTADHGESFGAHGEITHGMYVYDATLRVPFVLRRADRAHAGTRDAGVASVVDVFPTLADALGIEVPATDAVSLHEGRAPSQRIAFCETYFPWLAYGWSGLAGAWDRELKYLHSSKSELYDLAQDSLEERNLLPGAAARVAPYRAALEALARKARLSPAALRVDHATQMAALGYTGASSPPPRWPEPLAESDRRAPIDGRDELRAVMRGAELARGARWLEVLVKLDEVLATNPSNWFALDRRAYALLQLGRHAESLEAYRRLERDGPAWPATKANIATCLLGLDRPAEALVELDLRIAANPEDAWALETAARVARAMGDESRALDYERRRAGLGTTKFAPTAPPQNASR